MPSKTIYNKRINQVETNGREFHFMAISPEDRLFSHPFEKFESDYPIRYHEDNLRNGTRILLFASEPQYIRKFIRDVENAVQNRVI